MAKGYMPTMPFNVAMKILVPTAVRVYGVTEKQYSAPETSECFNGSFKTFGGTENIKDGVVTAIDTAVIETWYRPDITSDCRIYVCENGAAYDVVGTPEDIGMRHQYLKFKVQKVGGKV